MHIYLISPVYPPEISGAGHLIYEMAVVLRGKGHKITVLTGYPSYNYKEVQPKYLKGIQMDEMVDGINVRRIRFPSFSRSNMIQRGLQHFTYSIWLVLLMMITPRADVAVVFSPPLPLPWLAGLLGKLRRMPVVVNIQDLFPREAVELGVMTNPILIRLFEGMERHVYSLASAVTVHSPGNKEHVIAHGGQAERVDVVYNWVNTDTIKPEQKDNPFSRINGLQGKFVVSYAGTMGWAQDMGTVIASAKNLQNEPDILFLLVGDGVEKEKAQAMSAELGLKNIVWMPIQPLSIYPDILAASDVSLINLHPKLRTPVVPSKMLSIMAAGRPIVASLPAESDARVIIMDAGCGIFVEAGDGEALAKAISHIKSNPTLAVEMGNCGRAYVEAHFSRQVCIDQMEKILFDVTRRKSR